ncbi:MAG: protein kinase [Planctomycetes bacterium]|nr:protein kinase [Planctomycetota bacterium]
MRTSGPRQRSGKVLRQAPRLCPRCWTRASRCWAQPVRLGRFEVRAELGRGRFGIVYRAYDSRLQRDVAIKVARPEVTSRDDLATRFLQEAASAARLDHPGIVPVHDDVLQPGADDVPGRALCTSVRGPGPSGRMSY